MSRQLCQRCKRPLKTCLCDLFSSINNQVHVVILQHPNEVKQSKGSATLLVNSLKNCTLLTGECFNENIELARIIRHYQDQIYLLYPEKQATIISCKINQDEEKSVRCLILLDATWKKAYRMYQVSTNLQQLPKLQLPTGLPSYYAIRKTRVDNGLSTLEASCYALALLENNELRYQILLKNFITFNQRLLSFRTPKNNPISH